MIHDALVAPLYHSPSFRNPVRLYCSLIITGSWLASAAGGLGRDDELDAVSSRKALGGCLTVSKSPSVPL